eukprot:3065782-Prymnesium_polylepis.2
MLSTSDAASATSAMGGFVVSHVSTDRMATSTWRSPFAVLLPMLMPESRGADESRIVKFRIMRVPPELPVIRMAAPAESAPRAVHPIMT